MTQELNLNTVIHITWNDRAIDITAKGLLLLISGAYFLALGGFIFGEHYGTPFGEMDIVFSLALSGILFYLAYKYRH